MAARGPFKLGAKSGPIVPIALFPAFGGRGGLNPGII